MFFGKNKILCQVCGTKHGEHEPCPVASPSVQFQQQVKSVIEDTPAPLPDRPVGSEQVIRTKKYTNAIDVLRNKYQKQQVQEEENLSGVCYLCREVADELVYIIDRNNRPALPLCIECRDFIIQQFINEDER